MTKKRKWVFSILAILFILLAAGIIKGFTKEPVAHPEWVARWLEDPVCRPPCWESITPGETTMEEAYALLSANPIIIDVRKSPVQDLKFSISFTFDGKTGGGGLTSDKDGLLVNEISWTNYGNYGRLMQLHEVIRQYGEPTRVFVYPSPHLWTRLVILFYDELGMELSFIEQETFFSKEVRIKPDSTFSSVVFFSPQGDYLDRYANTLAHSTTLYAWRGYGRYSAENKYSVENEATQSD